MSVFNLWPFSREATAPSSYLLCGLCVFPPLNEFAVREVTFLCFIFTSHEIVQKCVFAILFTAGLRASNKKKTSQISACQTHLLAWDAAAAQATLWGETGGARCLLSAYFPAEKQNEQAVVLIKRLMSSTAVNSCWHSTGLQWPSLTQWGSDTLMCRKQQNAWCFISGGRHQLQVKAAFIEALCSSSQQE